MTDMQEPKGYLEQGPVAKTSVMTRVTATLGRNFSSTKDFREAQMMGMDSVIKKCFL